MRPQRKSASIGCQHVIHEKGRTQGIDVVRKTDELAVLGSGLRRANVDLCRVRLESRIAADLS
jgi:hypothetical protein